MKTVSVALAAVAIVAAAPSDKVERIGAWSFRVVTDPMTDATRGIASTEGEYAVRLVVKCDGNGADKVYASFIADGYLGSLSRSKFRSVMYRLDGAPPTEITAFYSDSSASIIPGMSGSKAAAFIAEVSRASKLTVQVTNYRGQPQTAVIDLTGAPEAIKRVATTCKDPKMASLLG